MLLAARTLCTGCEFPLWMQWGLVVYGSVIIALFINFYLHAYVLQHVPPPASCTSAAVNHRNAKVSRTHTHTHTHTRGRPAHNQLGLMLQLWRRVDSAKGRGWHVMSTLSPWPKSNSVYFRFKTRHLVATVLRIFPKLYKREKSQPQQRRVFSSVAVNGRNDAAPIALAPGLIVHWRPVATDGARCVVCLSVCVAARVLTFVTTVHSANTAELINMLQYGSSLMSAKQPFVRWQCTLAPPGNYGGSVCHSTV